LQTEPEEEAVDHQDQADEGEPPEAKTFPSGVMEALFERKRSVAGAPDDVGGFCEIGRGGEERGCEHHDHAENPGDDGSMEVVGIRSEDGELEEIELQDGGEDEAGNDGGHCGGGVSPAPEKTDREDNRERRGDVGETFLDEHEQGQLRRAEPDGGEDSEKYGGGSAPLTEDNERALGGLGPQEPLIDVHGQNGGGGVDHGGKMRHQCPGDGGEDDAAKTARDQGFDEQDVRLVGVAKVRKEAKGDDSRQHEEEGHDRVEEACSDDTHAGVPLVLRSQTALDNVLAGAVVPDTDAEKAGENSGRREHLIFRAVEDLEFGGDLVHQVRESADPVKADDRDEDSSEEEDGHLHEVGPGRGFEPTIHGVGRSEHAQEDDAPDDVDSEHALQGKATGIERACDEREEIADHAEDGEEIPCSGVVAALEKFGHGVEPHTHVVRKEDPDKERVDDPRVPAESGDDKTVAVGGSDLR